MILHGSSGKLRKSSGFKRDVLDFQQLYLLEETVTGLFECLCAFCGMQVLTFQLKKQ